MFSFTIFSLENTCVDVIVFITVLFACLVFILILFEIFCFRWNYGCDSFSFLLCNFPLEHARVTWQCISSLGCPCAMTLCGSENAWSTARKASGSLHSNDCCPLNSSHTHNGWALCALAQSCSAQTLTLCGGLLVACMRLRPPPHTTWRWRRCLWVRSSKWSCISRISFAPMCSRCVGKQNKDTHNYHIYILLVRPHTTWDGDFVSQRVWARLSKISFAGMCSRCASNNLWSHL